MNPINVCWTEPTTMYVYFAWVGVCNISRGRIVTDNVGNVGLYADMQLVADVAQTGGASIWLTW